MRRSSYGSGDIRQGRTVDVIPPGPGEQEIRRGLTTVVPPSWRGLGFHHPTSTLPTRQPPLRLARMFGVGLLTGILAIAGCARLDRDAGRLPTGARLDPAGRSVELGSMPLAMAFGPDSARIVVLLCGYREQGLQVVDPLSGRVTQTLNQRAAFLGLAFTPDGRTLYTSGGNQEVVYRYAWDGSAA